MANWRSPKPLLKVQVLLSLLLCIGCNNAHNQIQGALHGDRQSYKQDIALIQSQASNEPLISTAGSVGYPQTIHALKLAAGVIVVLWAANVAAYKVRKHIAHGQYNGHFTEWYFHYPQAEAAHKGMINTCAIVFTFLATNVANKLVKEYKNNHSTDEKHEL